MGHCVRRVGDFEAHLLRLRLPTADVLPARRERVQQGPHGLRPHRRTASAAEVQHVNNHNDQYDDKRPVYRDV